MYIHGRSLTRFFRSDGSGAMTVELPRESLELVLAALERVGARPPEDPTRSLFAKAADALVQMARESLAGDNAASTSSSAEGHQVVVHVEAEALSGQGGESDVPLPTVQRRADGSCYFMRPDGRPVENDAGESKLSPSAEDAARVQEQAGVYRDPRPRQLTTSPRD